LRCPGVSGVELGDDPRTALPLLFIPFYERLAATALTAGRRWLAPSSS
jgi:hypothetical protein